MLTVLLVGLVFVHSLHSTYITDNNERLLKNLQNTEVPEACRDQTYCTIRPPNYPIKVKADIETHYLRKRSEFMELNDDCQSEVTYEAIYKVRGNTDDNWRTVVDVGGDQPKIRLEVCRSPDKPCFLPFLEPLGYRTLCKQNFADVEMQVVSLDGNATELIKAQLPVACSCKYHATV